jgi:hypothetical protein
VLVVAGLLLGVGIAARAADEAADAAAVMATLQEMATATIDRDVPTLDRIYHADLNYNHSTGLSQGKAEIMKGVPSGSFTKMVFSDPRIRFYNGVAVVRVTTDLRYYPKGEVADRHLNQMFVMVKEGRGWQIVAKHTTRIAQ